MATGWGAFSFLQQEQKVKTNPKTINKLILNLFLVLMQFVFNENF